MAPYVGLSVTVGRTTLDARDVWCGWMEFRFAGHVSVEDAEGLADADILCDGGVRLPAAYCSSVLRDIIELVPQAGGDEAVELLCDGEEHGQQVALVGRDGVLVLDALEGGSPLCRISRDDGGSYRSELLECVAGIAESIDGMGDGEQELVLGGLALFCDCYDDEAVDAPIEDVRRLLGTLRE